MIIISDYKYHVGDIAFGGKIITKTDIGNDKYKLLIARMGTLGVDNGSIGQSKWIDNNSGFLGCTSTSGKTNTDLILQNISGAVSCAALLASNFSESGYEDWFLPSRYEIEIAKRMMSGGPYVYCWCSSEKNASQAWRFSVNPQEQSKTDSGAVIPFREQIITKLEDSLVVPTSSYLFLAGNPIEIAIGTGNSIRYRVYGGNNYDTILYVGMAYTIDGGSATIDISELFSGMKNTSGVQKVRVVKVDDEGNNWVGDADYIHKHDITIFGGGISNLYKRFLATGATNIFDFKLKNQETNFFLTTRTNDYTITIPEDELLPLYYYGSGMAFTVKNGDDVLAVCDHTAETDEVLHSIDFNQLRKLAVAELGRLVNYFRLTTSNGWACSVLITNVDQPSGCFLVFKNSWGCDEKIGVKGIVKYTPSITEASKIKRQDATTREFKTINQRTTYTNVYKLDVGYRTYEERMFLVDMLVNGIARIEINGMQLTVNIASSTEELAGTDFSPRNVELKISLQDTESMYSPINLETMYNVLTSGGADVEADGSKILV
jgi:hypothetical protein